jgi:hypothetical protein
MTLVCAAPAVPSTGACTQILRCSRVGRFPTRVETVVLDFFPAPDVRVTVVFPVLLRVVTRVPLLVVRIVVRPILNHPPFKELRYGADVTPPRAGPAMREGIPRIPKGASIGFRTALHEQHGKQL